MIVHLLKLVWKRKRSHALLILEIFASFLVLFAVSSLTAGIVIRWRMPLGFDYRNVWEARISFPPIAADTGSDLPQRRAAVEAMLREARALAPVESVAADRMPPYSQSTSVSRATANGHAIDLTRDSATDDFAKVMKLQILAGRWFTKDDEASPERAVVIDADAARALFGSAGAAVGNRIEHAWKDPVRVVGVVAPYRKDGEFSSPKMNMLFDRSMAVPSNEGFSGKSWGMENAAEDVPRVLLLRMRPGTAADFEETLIKRLHAVAPAYSVRIQHMDQARNTINRIYMAPAIVLGTIASFLIIMVALGLSGVLWQNVTRRTREIGLRRAVGATSAEVLRQILIEVVLLATLALTFGVIVVVQLPILAHTDMITPGSFGFGLAAALAVVYGITLLCGLYPSWLAGRVRPAQALHYE